MRKSCVQASGGRGTIVAFGDSITSGFLSTLNAAADYPARLAARLQATNKGRGLGLVNVGIIGNQVTNGATFFDGTPFLVFGSSALERLDRDILNQTNVQFLIWFEGANDIDIGGKTAKQIINGIQQAVNQVRNVYPHIKVFGGTLTPTGGSESWTVEHEATRQEINAWIRGSSFFDAVFDFDIVLRDPTNPTYLSPIYNAGDNVHPNDAGYQLIADSIDLSLFY